MFTLSLTIIGTGNVATHLARIFSQSGHTIDSIIGRNLEAGQQLAKSVNARFFSDIQQAQSNNDLYILAVKDDAIKQVSILLKKVQGLVVHTSGITSLNVLNTHERVGVFYPLQSLSKNISVSPQMIPILTEALNSDDELILGKLAKSCGMPTYSVNSADRQLVHLAAVFANNFTNYLYHISNQILTEKNIPFSLIQPLIEETAHKIRQSLPEMVQTGPAYRNDNNTIEAHLKLLQEIPQYRQVYDILSQGISNMKGSTRTL
jgi:predicted short-subunit dehydrogenase-like oxidoreductase (DUF2520 family)